MKLTLIDWTIVASYFALSTGIGLYFTRRGGASLSEYFLSGRAAPWWLAGASMVATTFAADTPLLVTGLVATKGFAGSDSDSRRPPPSAARPQIARAKAARDWPTMSRSS